MKIFKTKKMILAVVTAVVFVGALNGLQSCSSNNDIDSVALKSNLSSNLTKITSIPNGIEPIVVKDQKELNEFVDRLKNMKFENSQKTYLSESQNGSYSITHLNNYDKNVNNNRFKMKSESGWTIKSFTGYDIRVECSCDHIGSSKVMLTSNVTNYSVGHYYWVQNQASASWESNELKYSIEGTVSCYLVVYGSGEYFLWQKDQLVSGYLYIS